MLDTVIREQFEFLENIKNYKEKAYKRLAELSFYYSINPDLNMSKFQILLPMYFTSTNYYLNQNYLYFKDFFNAEFKIQPEENNVIWEFDLKNLKSDNKIGFIQTLESDLKNIFRDIIEEAESFHRQFEIPFARNPSKKIVIKYLHNQLTQNKALKLCLIYFIPFLNEFEKIGLLCDFNNNLQDHDSFAFYTGDRLKFIPKEEIILESFKATELEHRYFEDFNPSVKGWLYHTIQNLKLSNFVKFVTHYQHLRDYLNSEDIDHILPTINKIGINDMIYRSQKWLDKIERIHLKEKLGDTVDILSLDNLKIVQLLTTHSLDRESSFLKHCIGRGAYDKYIFNPTTRLYSVRNKNNEPLATLEITNSELSQLQGFKNTQPDTIVIRIVKRFIKTYGIKIHNPEYLKFLS